MKIGICAEYVGMRSGGPETYIANLIKSIAEIDKGNDYEIFVIRQDSIRDLNLPQTNFHICPLGIYNSWIRHLIVRPVQLMKRPVDILHVQDASPIGYRGKLVATVHDISFELFPDTFPKGMRYRLSIFVKRMARKADVVLTVSENTKRDLVKIYGISPEKIEVIYNAHDSRYRCIRDTRSIEETKRKYGIHGKFILYVGALQPRKNVVGLVKAYDFFREKYGLEWKLVLVGKEAWLYSGIVESIRNIEHRKDLICTGYIPEDELPYIYNAADLFVYPSFYEGFGLAVLEAMACGVPVVTSNNSSLPEVVGDAGILIDPYDCSCIAEAMYKGLHETELRNRLIQKGIERAKEFSWEITAKKTLDVYSRLLGG